MEWKEFLAQSRNVLKKKMNRLRDKNLGRIYAKIFDRKVTLLSILGFLVLFVLVVFADVKELLISLGKFKKINFLYVVVLTSLGQLIRFGRWEYYLKKLNVNVSLRNSLMVFLSGFMFTLTPGKVGEAWKAWILEKSDQVAKKRTVTVVGAERLTDLMAVSFLSFLGVIVYTGSISLIFYLTIGYILLVFLLQWRSFCLGFLGAIDNFPVVSRFAKELEEMYNHTYVLFKAKPLFISLLASIMAWSLEGIALWLTIRGLGVQASLIESMFVFGFGSVVGAVSMLPGGLGATEASMTGLLVTMGYASSIAVAATLILRAGTLWYGAVLGAIVFLLFWNRMKASE